MNSAAREFLRSNARRRTPLSNSTRLNYNRVTTELYSSMDAPTTHPLPQNTGATRTRTLCCTTRHGARDAGGDAAPNSPAATPFLVRAPNADRLPRSHR
jgi:hypothetical protein